MNNQCFDVIAFGLAVIFIGKVEDEPLSVLGLSRAVCLASEDTVGATWSRGDGAALFTCGPAASSGRSAAGNEWSEGEAHTQGVMARNVRLLIVVVENLVCVVSAEGDECVELDDTEERLRWHVHKRLRCLLHVLHRVVERVQGGEHVGRDGTRYAGLSLLCCWNAEAG